MKGAPNFAELKNETAQIILSLEDEELLARIRELLYRGNTPSEDLEGIDRGRAAILAGDFSTLEDYLEELDEL